MTGTGPLIRPMTPADRPALANFPNRVSTGSANFRFHGSLTMLTDKTLNLLPRFRRTTPSRGASSSD
jgi:hypothetical protein